MQLEQSGLTTEGMVREPSNRVAWAGKQSTVEPWGQEVERMLSRAEVNLHYIYV